MAHGSTPVYNCPNCGLIWQIKPVDIQGKEMPTCGGCGTYRVTPATTTDGAPVVHLLKRDEKLNLTDSNPDNLTDE